VVLISYQVKFKRKKEDVDSYRKRGTTVSPRDLYPKSNEKTDTSLSSGENEGGRTQYRDSSGKGLGVIILSASTSLSRSKGSRAEGEINRLLLIKKRVKWVKKGSPINEGGKKPE